MFNYLKKAISWRNLGCRQVKGQIATLLLLFTVAIIVFILATVNIGSTSLQSIRITKAVDTGVLNLASMLATSANQKYIVLGQNYQVVEKGGAIAAIVAAIVTIACWVVGTVVPGMQWLLPFGVKGVGLVISLLAISTVAGAITGGLAFNSWQAAAQGAIDGFTVGATIAGGASAFTTIFSGPTLLAGGLTVVKTIGAFLGAASTIVNEAITDASTSRAISRALSELPGTYTPMRENIFYNVLSQIVTDNRRVPDKDDIDGDGNSTEQIRYFDQWYYDNHVIPLRASNQGGVRNLINILEENVLWYNGSPTPNPNSLKEFINQTDRYGLECASDCCQGINTSATGIDCPQGRVEELFRNLKACPSAATYLSFYNSNTNSPTRAQMQSWYNCAQSNCPKPSGADDLVAVHEIYKKYVDLVQTLRDKADDDIQAMENNRDWVDDLYSPDDPEDPNTMYGGLGHVLSGKADENFQGMWVWVKALEQIRSSAPKCQLAYDYYYPDVATEGFTADPGSSRRTGTPPGVAGIMCGAPYDPRADGNHFYPCVWKKDIYNSPGVLGTYFPNSTCKVTPDDKTGYLNQLSSLTSFVTGLEDYIIKDPRNASIFSALLCPPAGQAALTQPTYSIIIRRISLSGDKQPRCSTTAARNAATLTYEFQVSLKCCDSAGATCLNNAASSAWTTRSNLLDGVDPVLSYPVRDITGIGEVYDNDLVNAPSAKDTFLQILTQMAQDAGAIVTSNQAYFVSADADLDDELNPVLDAIQSQEDTIATIRTAIKNFVSNSSNSNETNGAGSATYNWPCRGATCTARVETGPFIFPKIKEDKKKFIATWIWHKNTYTLMYHCDNMYGCSYNTDRTWVRGSLSEPANIPVTSSTKLNFGNWNPSSGGAILKTITKRTHAYFSVNAVGIARRDK